MNYSELSSYATNYPHFAKHKAEVDKRNAAILAKRQEWLNSRQGVTVGDFIRDGEKLLRVAHIWDDRIQPCTGGSFYLGPNYVSMSGGLDSGIPTERFKATDERMDGSVWFFSEDFPTAHNGYYTTAKFRVWKLMPKA